MFKGAIHIHSTYSDGEMTLARLREVYSAAGYRFLCMTDHAEGFDESKLQAYIEECRVLSDDRFLFIPGLEYGCRHRMHVLGLGVTRLVTTDDPQEVIRQIESEGGISVIAHPTEAMFEWLESFDALPCGIEVWNSKYDGRYAPRPATFRLLARLREREPSMRAFYGQDMHWKKQFRGLFNLLRCESLRREDILAALVRGDYFAVKDGLELPSSGELPLDLLMRFANVNERSRQARRLIKSVKRKMDRLGLQIPAPIKSQLRRIF
jgi:hypothetical protein